MDFLRGINIEVYKTLGAAFLAATVWLVTRKLNNKKVKELEKKLLEVEVSQKYQAKEDEKAKNWLGFVREQVELSVSSVRAVLDEKFKFLNKDVEIIKNRLDEGDRRFDKLEATVGQIASKIPMFKEPNGHSKALLIEDDILNANLITQVLEDLGILVVRVNSSKDAILKINQYHEKPFDFALADKNLNGDLADVFINYCVDNNLLLGTDNLLKIIIYSGSTDVVDNKWGLPYLEKPFNRNDLQEKVKKYLPVTKIKKVLTRS